MKELDKRTLVLVTMLLISVLVVFGVSYYAIPRVLVTFSRAAGSGKPVLNNAYFVGTKLLAKADGEDKCVVNVFVVDGSGKGVAGRKVELSRDNGMVVEPSAVQTDAVGKATFSIASKIEGQFALKPVIDGVELVKELTATFRN